MTLLAPPPSALGSPLVDDLRRLYADLAPKTVGCFLAEDLAHVPIAEFLHGGSRVWAVDWWRGRPHQAMAASAVREEGGEYTCRISGRGAAACRSFVTPPDGRSQRVCASFVLVKGAPPRCGRFAPGPEPTVLVADGAMGRAARFAMRVEEIVVRSRSADEALRSALAECQPCAEMDLPVDVPTGSLDLVISVLVPTRIGEPSFNYTRGLLRRRFGPSGDAARLAPILQRLRAALFRMQIEGHLRELHRLVDKSRGHVCVVTEPVASTGRENDWALAPGIPLLLELIHRHFTFDFGRLSLASFLRHASAPDGRAQLVQAVVLRPRKRLLPAREPWSALASDGGEP